MSRPVTVLLALALLAALPAEPAEADVYNMALVFVTAYPVRSDGPATYTEADPGDSPVHARFRVRANPYMGSSGSFPDPLTIRYQVTQQGDFVAASEIQTTTTTVTPTINTADIYIPITADNVNEADGKITLKVLPGSNYIIEEDSNPAFAIVRDDDTPGVSFGGTTLAVVEGTDDPFQAVLRVEPPSHQDITVRLWTQEPPQGRWSATEGDDYAGQASIDVPISAGTRNVTVEVNRDTTTGVEIKDDNLDEDYEHFYLKLASGREGYEISGRDWLRVTIIDDENPPPMPQANDDGTYTVPMDWPLVPEELRKTGGEFRLLFLTNTWRDATSSNIADYDAHVRASVAGSHTGGSHPAITPYSDAFKVVASTPTVNARDHIDAGREAPIYWLNGPRVAVDNEKFWSNSWEHWAAHDRRTAASVSVADLDTRQDWHWTGTNVDGTKHSLSSLGSPGHAIRGQFFEEGLTRNPWVGNSETRVNNHSLLGISPVFRVEKRPRLQIASTETGTQFISRRLGWRSGTYRMLVANEPAACANPANDVSALGGIVHPSDLVNYRVRLYADPAGQTELYVYNPKYVVYRQGSLAKGPVDSDHRNEIWKREIAFSNFYNEGITVRPPGYDTTYAISGGPPSNTYISLDFDSGNWDQWQTVSVNVHCADHEDDNAYIIQHELTLPGDRFNGRDRIGRGITWDLTTWHDVRVNVIDTKSAAEPADLSVATAYDGVLSANLLPYGISQWCEITTEDTCEWLLSISYKWTTTDTSTTPPTVNPNDLFDATRHFSSFRIKLEGDSTVSGAGADPQLPITIYDEDPSFVIGHQRPINRAPYLRGFRSGLIAPRHSQANPGDPVYRITITPVSIRGNEVPGEAVTMCVQLQSLAGQPEEKRSVRVDCSLFTAPANDVPVVQRAFSKAAQDDQGSGPEVTVASDVRSVTEGGQVTFTISASPAPAVDTPVLFSVTEKMGSGDDLIARGSSEFLTIPAGQGSVAVTVDIFSDDDGRADGTVFAEVVDGDGYTLGDPASVTLTLLDDDGGGGSAGYTVDPNVVSQVKDLASQTQHGSAHVNRWNRVLVAFGEHDGTGVTGGAMTAAEAREMAQRHSSPVWDLVVAELTALEAAPAQTPPPTPVVSITGSLGGTEGVPVTFTVAANPAPAADLPVGLTVATSGDFGYGPLPGSVTVPASGSATVSIATADDEADEADGSVTLTLNAGSGYTVGAPSSVTVSVTDDDEAAEDETGYTVDPSVVSQVKDLASQTQHGSAHVNRWNRVLVAFGEHDGTGVTGGAMTAAEAREMAQRHSSPVWDLVVTELTALEAASSQTPPPTPEVSVSAGSGVTEGGDATFTVTASPAPASNLAVSVTVSQSGDYGATTGRRTVTVPATGSVTLTVGTAGDSADEPDGSVTATVNAGSGYTVSSAQGAATVAVADDDDPPPVVEITVAVDDASAVEGDMLEFRVRLSEAPAEEFRVSWYTSPAYHLLDNRAHLDDYQATAGEMVFGPDVTELTGEVWLEQDSEDEPDEYFAVEAFLPGSFMTPDAVGTMTIIDDD